jgi:membrane protease YdiL (CAAX protease family)
MEGFIVMVNRPDTNPVFAPLILYLIALSFRVTDIFILRLDERWGEIILSKSLGFLLVLAYVWLSRAPMASIGLHRRQLGASLAVGGLLMAAVHVIGFGLQWLLLFTGGREPALLAVAIDPKTGMTGGLLFGLWLVLGNLVNSFMEEGLFRGVMLPHFQRRMNPARANWLQALLFSLWHAVWPVKDYLTGRATLGEAVTAAAMLCLATLVSGYVFGVLFQATGSLWAPWLAHTVNNTTLNLLHIRTNAGLDSDMLVVQLVLMAGLLAMVPLSRALARRWGLKPL